MNDKAITCGNRAASSEHRIRGRGQRVFWVIVLIGVAAALTIYVTGCTDSTRHQRGFFTETLPHRIHDQVGRALTQVDATDEQREKVAVLLKSLDSDTARWQEERQALRDRFMQALQAEQVNQNDLATIKSAGVTLAHQALGRTVDAMFKVSEVLTPKQRKELVAKWRTYQ
jgi:Spy/CpxP family protein refolding chaperone